MMVRASSGARHIYRQTALAVLLAVAAACVLFACDTASATTGSAQTPPSAPVPAGDAGGVHAFGELIEKPTGAFAKPAQTAASLPASKSLTAYDVPVGNQGPVGSCVTWAIVYAMVGWYQNYNNLQLHLLNPMSVYSQVHINNSTDPKAGYGGGSYPSDVLNDLRGTPVNGATPGADTMTHYSHHAWDWIDRPNSSSRRTQGAMKSPGLRRS